MSCRIDMSIPQAGKEGYLIKVTPENYLELLEMVPELEPDDLYVNYDPDFGNTLIPVGNYTRKSVFAETTLITVEELKALLFIKSLED